MALVSCNVFAQESVNPMLFNPYLKDQTNHKKSVKSSLASLSLPFFDDFSDASRVKSIPNQNLWRDKNVYINTSFGFEPISIGVATFDAIDSTGRLYSKASQNLYFNADTLTSQFINLKNRIPADSIYLSFFCQAGGFGDVPDENDYLYLLFSQPGTKPLQWDTVWFSNKIRPFDFKQFFVAVDQEKWLKDSFQFRFVNRVSINLINNDPGKNTNGDIWNLDYVYLNANRTYTDSAYQEDYAIIYPPFQSMLKGFESIPWSQYKLPTVYSKIRADRISIPIRNYRDNSINVESEIGFFDVYENVEIELNTNSSEADPDSLFYIQEAIPKLISDMKDSALFEIRLNIYSDTFDNPVNNSVSYQQVLSNYFAYDDGTAEYGYGISGEGSSTSMFAMRFETFKEEALKSVKMFLNESLAPRESISKNFYLTIWNEKTLDNRKIPGDTLYKKNIGQFNDTIGWKTYKIDTFLVLPKVYYIGWVQQSEYFGNVGFDINRNYSKNAFYNLQGTPEGWIQSAIDGTVMIRPVIDPKANVTNATVNKETISVYPNPAVDVLNFILPDEFYGKNFRIQISSITGFYNMVKEQSQDYLNIQHLQPGVYILKITKPDGSVMTSKFIKNAR